MIKVPLDVKGRDPVLKVVKSLFVLYLRIVFFFFFFSEKSATMMMTMTKRIRGGEEKEERPENFLKKRAAT